MTSPAFMIATYLDQQGAATLATDLFIGMEPPAPASTVTVYNTGGAEPEPDQDLWRPTVQIRVRGVDYESVYSKQQSIRALLVAPASFTVGGYDTFGIFPSSDIIDIGRDENERFRMTANYRMLTRET